MSNVVEDRPEQTRYELRVDGELAAFVDYTLEAGVISFHHTEIVPAFEGQGLAKVLVAGALDQVGSRRLEILPVCPFVAGFIRKNADRYLTLVPVERRAEFDLPA